ncbi:DUF742 domain-containing protein [Streptomyces sp. 8L]|uniref:DUF742 domain-containing protein n=1 Tax=Streptomyces sp. 8L TaxID=2877242 RepID=UPI0035A82E35
MTIPPNGTDPDDADEPADATEQTALVRPFVFTGGRPLPKDDEFDLTVLVWATPDAGRRGGPVSPEKQRLLDLCSGGFLSVAEVVGHTGLPVGVVKLLLADLTEQGHLRTRAPIARAQRHDPKLLQEVLDGLRKQRQKLG